MGEKSGKIFDLAIDRKLQSSFIVSCSREELFKISKHSTKPSSRLANIVSDRAFNVDNDLYNNKVYKFINSKTPERKRINLLGFFSPGEIINSVMNQ